MAGKFELIDGVKIHYKISGSGPSALLLIHGAVGKSALEFVCVCVFQWVFECHQPRLTDIDLTDEQEAPTTLSNKWTTRRLKA